MAELSRAPSPASPELINETMGPSVLKLLVSDRQAGKLIGKHGANVGQIGTSCHVVIRVSASNMFFPGTSDRVVLIGGDPVNLETALVQVLDKIGNPMAESHFIVLVVHGALLSHIVGPGCSLLQQTAREMGVSLHLHSKLDGLNERTIRISHRNSMDAVISAVLSLSSRILSDPLTLGNLQMNYDSPIRTAFSLPGSDILQSGVIVELDGTSRTEDGTPIPTTGMSLTPVPGSDEEAHLAAASLLPFDEIKVDTDLLKGPRNSEADELVCKICHTYFLGCAPKLTKCAHAFCGDCLESWIQVQPTFRSWAQVAKTAGQARLVPCPVCKTPLNDKTDIHLILTETSEPDCVKMAKNLLRLEISCHNNPNANPLDGNTCNWEGSYKEYQAHARVCTKNRTKSLIEPNTTAPPESHQESATQNRDQATVVIPFTTTDLLKDTISVQAGNSVTILERSDEGWIYVRNASGSGEGWVPDYCIKRYDAWFEDMLSSSGKHVEKCCAIRDFDPLRETTTKGHVGQFQFLPLREGDVFTVCERSKNGWNLVINSDGSRQGWVPDSRCKIIREGSDHNASSSNVGGSVDNNSISQVRTYVVRKSFDGDEKRGELNLNQGETVSVRQAHDSGWTFGVIVTGGSKKEGWFPDWVIERSILDKSTQCVHCNTSAVNNLTTFVRISGPQLGRPQDLYGPVCSTKCWEQWCAKKTVTPRPGQPRK